MPSPPSPELCDPLRAPSVQKNAIAERWVTPLRKWVVVRDLLDEVFGKGAAERGFVGTVGRSPGVHLRQREIGF